MRNPKKGDRVEINTGKHQGQIGTVTSVEGDRIIVQIPGLPYERWFGKLELEYKGREEPILSTGDARRKRIQVLVKAGELCPSYPHACSGECRVFSSVGSE